MLKFIKLLSVLLSIFSSLGELLTYQRYYDTTREQTIAKARQKNKVEREQDINGAEKPTVEPAETTDATATDKKTNDSVKISDSGKAAITEQMLSGETDMLIQNAVTEVYSSSAKAQPLEQPQHVVMDVKV